MSAATGIAPTLALPTEAPTPRASDRLAMAGVRHGIAWERRVVLFLIESALHHAAGRPDAVEALEKLRISVEAYG